MDTTLAKTDPFITALGIDRSKVYIFFEAALLAKALTQACHTRSPVRTPPEEDQDDVVQLPQKHGFAKAARCYLDKLALLCSNTPGCGDISSVVLLQDADSILYVIGSNNRNQQNLEETALFVQSLFKALNVEDSVFQDEGQRSELSAQLMRKILLFHRKRVKVYLNGVANEIKECQRTDEDHPISKHLDNLLPHVEQCKALTVQICDESFSCTSSNEELVYARQKHVSSYLALIPRIAALKRVLNSVYDRSRPGNKPSTWASLLHWIGRILSYACAPEMLISARQTWPDIFTSSVQLVLIPSSIRMPNPFPRKRQNATADELINRVFNNAKDRQMCREQAEEIQSMSTPNLDTLLKKEFEAKSLKPCVHCEVLMHDWLTRRSGGTITPEMFFFNDPYIGVGKPPCRMCWSYLSTHPSGVGVRKSHGNLYPAWRMPDSYASLDYETERQRLQTIEKVKDDLRELCKRTLGDKQARRKERDSETSSSRPSVFGGGLGNASLFLGSGTQRARQGIVAMVDETQVGTSSDWKMGGSRPRTLNLTLGMGSRAGAVDAGMGISRPPSSTANETLSWGDEDIDQSFAKLSVDGGSSTSRVSGSSTDATSGSTSGGESSSLGSPRSMSLEVEPEVGGSDSEDDDDDGGGVVVFRGRGK